MSHSEILDIITEEQLDALQKLRVFKRTAVRNMYIRRAFDQLKNEGVSAEDAKNVIGQHWSLSYDQVERIVYRKKGEI